MACPMCGAPKSKFSEWDGEDDFYNEEIDDDDDDDDLEDNGDEKERY
jgi:hypothetical protein